MKTTIKLIAVIIASITTIATEASSKLLFYKINFTTQNRSTHLTVQPSPNADTLAPSISELRNFNRMELAQKFPEGYTEQNFTSTNYQIKRIVVVKGTRGDDYRMIHFNWGQTFYKKNGSDISEALFNHETSKNN